MYDSHKIFLSFNQYSDLLIRHSFYLLTRFSLDMNLLIEIRVYEIFDYSDLIDVI